MFSATPSQVVGTDSNLMSVLQYAVCHLKVKHIIICGHYNCGGIAAAMGTKNPGPPLESWLRNIRCGIVSHTLA